jgi:hypothetical protein
MSHNHWIHALHTAHNAEHRGEGKAAAWAYIVIGFFMAPLLIGIPIMIYGFYKLAK